MNRGLSRGSLTIFSALSFMLAASFLLALLEAAHVAELSKVTRMDAEVRIESLFAAYQKEAWKNWNILILDGANDSNTVDIPYLEELAMENCAQKTDGTNLINFRVCDCEIESYTLITDQNGSVYRDLAVSYTKESIPFEIAQKLYGEYEAIQTLDSTSGEAVEKAIEILEDPESVEVSEEQKDKTVTQSEKNVPKEEIRENPLEIVDELMTKSILGLVVEDISKLSDKRLNLSECVSGRNRETGVHPVSKDADWYDKILFDQYLSTQFGCFTNIKEGHALDYEQEYLLYGNARDQKNLEEAVLWLMSIREGANLLYLLSDSEKLNEALIVATILAGVSANPAVIEAVKYGILAAWAYVESILDIRALLQGEAIAFIKSKDSWTSDIYGLASSLGSYAKAKSSKYGMKYERYLEILLMFPSESKIAYHAMDLQEAQIRTLEGCNAFCMDHMIVSMKMCFSYRWPPVFLPASILVPGKVDYFSASQRVEYSYVKA